MCNLNFIFCWRDGCYAIATPHHFMQHSTAIAEALCCQLLQPATGSRLVPLKPTDQLVCTAPDYEHEGCWYINRFVPMLLELRCK